jgi:predicted dehydrogenase/nucleoside-diphosphate-sugar epimerase
MDKTKTGSTEGQRLRIGLLGAGQMAQQHARAIARLGNLAELVAIADPYPVPDDMRAEHPQAAVFGSLQEMLRALSLDVIHICTPPDTHEDLAQAALEAGSHIYVEKPFVETRAAAVRLYELAEFRGLKVCSGHQLLFEPPTLAALKLLPKIGELTHIESYFSFRAIKRLPSGRAPLRDDLQLLDILPHPVYLLLDFLERACEGTTELRSVEIGPNGTVHAMVRRGPLTGNLVVTLHGRPVESYLRLVGTNGSLHADYVRSTLQRQVGPGTSGIDKLLSPYRISRQLLTGTTAAMGRRFLKKQRSYPGLAEIFGAFYHSIQNRTPVPVTRTNLIETVGICERISAALAEAFSSRPAVRSGARTVVVTGGTGLLGKEVARILSDRGTRVRVLARRAPPAWDEVPGVDYFAVDISRPLPPEVMRGADAVIHCAAETAGGWEQHQKNSIDATVNVIEAAGQAGVKQLLHVSSISVLAVPRRGKPLSEDTPIEPRPRTGGPYAWGKIESERLAVERCRELGIELRIVRPAALVDYRNFEQPGLLGKRAGNIFVAVGFPWYRLGVVDVVFSAETLAWITSHFDEAPPVLNLFEPELPTKRELLTRLRADNPDLSVVWLPLPILVPLSWFAVALQKILRPRSPALNLAKVFARLRYDTSRIAALAPAIKAEASRQEAPATTGTDQTRASYQTV